MSPSSVRNVLAAAAALAGSCAAAVDPPRQPQFPRGGGKTLVSWNDTVVNDIFEANYFEAQWAFGGQDGDYITLDDAGDVIIVNAGTGQNRTVIDASKVPSNVNSAYISKDESMAFFGTDCVQQYPFQVFCDYTIYDFASGQSSPLVPDQDGDIQIAYALDTNMVVYVRNNNIFFSMNGTITPVTDDGSPLIFNGVPSWVYGAEYFNDGYTMWASPDGQYIVYLTVNETDVMGYSIPNYMNGQPIAPQYPSSLDYGYPKAGTPNPIVTMTLLNVATLEKTLVPLDAYKPEDTIFTEFLWSTEEHSSFVYKVMNRVQDRSTHVRVDIDADGKISSQQVRVRDGTDGWLDNWAAMQYVGKYNGKEYYADLTDESGWNHIVLYSLDGDSAAQINVTSGEWEVLIINYIDLDARLIYYTSTQAGSMQAHCYVINWETGKTTALVDVSVPAYWGIDFSPHGSYYVLSYIGPDVPFMEIYARNDTQTALSVPENNDALLQTLADYSLPQLTVFTLDHPDGYKFNVQQRLPPNFDPSKKYAVLFMPASAPGSQSVMLQYLPPQWESYIASDPDLEYISYVVDGRGSGWQGRAYRSLITSKLGVIDVEDQIWAAQELAKQNSWIDTEHIGIYGWSYDGYLAGKVLEANSGVFTMGIMSAPATDWRFMDTIWTERYMKLMADNEAAYNASALSDPTGFTNLAGKLSVLHGTADDYYHYQHTAAFVDMLLEAGVNARQFEWRAFTDSKHSINYGNQGLYAQSYIVEALFQEKLRQYRDAKVHQWTF